MTQANYYKRIVVGLHHLKERYPSYSMGKHLSTIIDDCGDIWGTTDKELYNALTTYSKQLAIDVPHEDNDLDTIINEGLHLNTLFLENDNIYEDD